MKPLLNRRTFILVLSVAAMALAACLVPGPKPAAAPSGAPLAGSPAAPATLEVYPNDLKLESHRASRQLVVTAKMDGEVRDVTHLAVFRSSDEKVVKISGGAASAAGDGVATITVAWGDRSLTVPVSVANYSQPDPIRFKFETMAVLTKQGCATGSCHGSPVGKAGFALSLFGYDPTIDRRSLTRDGFNRRVNPIEPTESLMLRKPLMELDHGGGKRLHKGEAPYETLLAWIKEGANVDLPAVECERIEVFPGPERVLKSPHLNQQLSVLAHYSDGSVRDVTSIATYDTSNAELAAVDPAGLVTARQRGQAAISVRYLSQVQSVNFTTIMDVPGFAWKAPPEANMVDTLVNAKLRQLQYLPAETCDDATFVRRLYLDLTGLIPTADDARRFITTQEPDKRAKLIDELLASEAYARFWAMKDADLMRVSKTRLRDGRAEIFSEWLVNAQRQDLPYTEFARKLLTASGDSRKVPEANFLLAMTTLQECTETTAQLFLGSRLDCTRCHNHPYEKWTMNDYYSLSAVFARTVSDQNIISTTVTGEAFHPLTKAAMKPWGFTATTPDTADRRAQFANWLTQPDNPFFARVEVNRIWAQLLGRGIVEPVDDFRSSNPPSNGPLLNALAKEFVAGGYRRKAIIRLVCNSQTYQRSAETTAANATEDTLFSHARTRLLTAEQLKDAVGLAAGTLIPLTTTPEQLDRNEAELAARRAELEPTFAAWLERASADVAQRDFWAGGWYAVGPFSLDPNDENATDAFGPELAPVDFAAAFDQGKRSWHPRPEWNDPEPTYTMDAPKNSTFYVAREIFTRTPMTLKVTAVGNGMIWVNAKPALKEALKGEGDVELPLAAGRNLVLMKLVGKEDEASFRFRADVPASAAAPGSMTLLPQVLGLLAKPVAQITPAERQTIHDYYPQMDEGYLAIQRRQAFKPSTASFATQRPVPEADPFMAAFGQPKRETACSCERTNAPTLLQALELLNGKTVYASVQTGSARYAKLDESLLYDQLYLSALARLPSAKERTIAQQFLASAPKRDDGVTDLLWSLLNTSEFLFQH